MNQARQPSQGERLRHHKMALFAWNLSRHAIRHAMMLREASRDATVNHANMRSCIFLQTRQQRAQLRQLGQHNSEGGFPQKMLKMFL
jgi:hypothetical protein